MAERTLKRSYSDVDDADIALLKSEKRKYVTFSFDDGVTQDKKLVKLLDTYGAKCTFNVNFGLLGTGGRVPCYGKTIDHIKVTADDVKNGLYKDHELAAHGFTHAYLPQITLEQVTEEFTKDVAEMERLTGEKPLGCAYPCGLDPKFGEIAEHLKNTTCIKYGRTINSTYGFGAPENFMLWHPTILHFDGTLFDVCDRFIASRPEQECKDLFFYVWGHAYEFDAVPDAYENDERLLERLAKEDDVIFVTNRVIFKLLGGR